MYGLAYSFFHHSGESARWVQDWSSELHWRVSSPTLEKIGFTTGFSGVYQQPFSGEINSQERPHDAGYFWIADSADPTDKLYMTAACPAGIPNTESAGHKLEIPQCVTPVPAPELGDLLPVYDDMAPHEDYSNPDGDWWAAGRYMNPFVVEHEPDGGWFASAPPDTVYNAQLFATFPGIPSGWPTATINHYQPWAWSGNPTQCLAAVLLQAGSGDTLDRGAMSVAEYSYALAPWSAKDYTMHLAREYGTAMSGLCSEIVGHTRDDMFFNMRGELSVASKQWPFIRDEINVTDDHISEGFSWGRTSDHIFNKASLGYGGEFIVTGNPQATGWDAVHSGLGWVPATASRDYGHRKALVDKWSVEIDNTTSQGGHGIISLDDETATFPYYMLIDGDIPPYTRWETADGDFRYFAVVEQDILGLAYDVGWRVNDVNISSNWDSSRRTCRCVEKTVDFDNLMVESTFLEDVLDDGDMLGSTWTGSTRHDVSSLTSVSAQ